MAGTLPDINVKLRILKRGIANIYWTWVDKEDPA